MVKVGYYNWRQISMWDFPPDNCVETYITAIDFGDTYHYYLTRVTEVISESSRKIETVVNVDEVPIEVLRWREGEVFIKVNGVRRPVNYLTRSKHENI